MLTSDSGSTNLDALLRIAGPALSESTPRLPGECSALAGALAPQLLKLLWARNGFLAFESALHVRPLSDERGQHGLAQWNVRSLWREAYQGMADGALFFAEDAFGGQFCIANDEVQRFEPETGNRERVASSIDEWTGVILADSEALTGWPLAHEWQQRFGALPNGKRLVPKLPFVLGGEFSSSNLHLLDGVKAMRFYGDIAVQIRDVPDGSSVRLRVVD